MATFIKHRGGNAVSLARIFVFFLALLFSSVYGWAPIRSSSFRGKTWRYMANADDGSADSPAPFFALSVEDDSADESRVERVEKPSVSSSPKAPSTLKIKPPVAASPPAPSPPKDETPKKKSQAEPKLKTPKVSKQAEIAPIKTPEFVDETVQAVGKFFESLSAPVKKSPATSAPIPPKPPKSNAPVQAIQNKKQADVKTAKPVKEKEIPVKVSREAAEVPTVQTQEIVDQTVDAVGKFVEALVPESVVKTIETTKQTLEEIPVKVEKVKDDVTSFPGKVKAQVDDVQRGIEKSVDDVQKGIETSVQTTKDVVDTVKAIPSNAKRTAEEVKQSYYDTQDFVVQTVDDIKAIPDNVDRKVKEIKQTIDETQAAIDQTIEDVKGIPAKVDAFKNSAIEFKDNVQDFVENVGSSPKKKGVDGFDDDVAAALKAAQASLDKPKKKAVKKTWWQPPQ